MGLNRILLIPQVLAYELHMDAAFNPLAFDCGPNVTDTGGSFAVHTNPVFNTRGFDAHAYRIYWSGIMFGPGDGRFHIGNNLIHTHNQNDLFGAENHCGHPVSQSIEIN